VSPRIKKAIQIIKYLLLSLVLLFFVLVGTINLPFVHKALTKKANTILSEKNIPVHIGKITLLLNGKIGVNELAIIVPPGDTVIYAGKVRVNLGILPLLSKEIVIRQLILTDAVVNIETDTITGEMNIISVFNPAGTTTQEPETETESSRKQWDFKVNLIRLKNIRVNYNDPVNGISVTEKLAKAEIDFDIFSLTEKRIEAGKITIEKSEGTVAIWQGTNTQQKDSTATPDWKFAVKKLEIANLDFALHQPESGQHIYFNLENGNISLKKLELATNEILIDEIILTGPNISFETDSTNTIETTAKTDSTTFSIPVVPWHILVEKFNIKNGMLAYKTSDKTQNETLGKWLPVQELNVSFENTRVTPNSYRVNLEKISFALSNTLRIESGDLHFFSDSLQNMGLEVHLSALLNETNGFIAEKQTLGFSTKAGGNTAALKISEFGISSTTGLKFNLGGTIENPLKMLNSACDLQFASGAVSREMLVPVLSNFSPQTELPKFRPFTISGNVKNALYNPFFDMKINSESGKIAATGNFDMEKTRGKLDASFTEIMLGELLGDIYPEIITGNIKLNGGLNSKNMPDGNAGIQIDSLRYKNKTTRDISMFAEVLNDEAKVKFQSNDSALHLDLNGNFDLSKKNAYSGNLKGLFDIDLFGLKLMNEPFAGKGSIESDFTYSTKEINASLNLTDFTVQNKNAKVILEKTLFELNSSDSAIISHLESDFITANFESKASFADFKNAYDKTQAESIVSIDSTNFANLDAISNLPFFNLSATVKHDEVFHLFYPDSVMGFSDINLEIIKKDRDSLAEATMSAKSVKYGKILTYNPNILIRVEHDRLIARANTDSSLVNELVFGKSGVNFEVFPASVIAEIEVLDKNDSIIHQIGIEAKRESDKVLFQSATKFWLINKIQWTLTTPQFLTFDKPAKNLVANLEMNSNEGHISLTGQSADTLYLELNNVDLSYLAIPIIADYLPHGILSGNIKYSQKQNTSVKLELEMVDLKWSGISFKRLTANGFLKADSTGINDSELLITADDSLSFSAQMESNNKTDEFLIKSKFNKLQFQLFESFIDEYANRLHGNSSGEITIESKKSKMSLNGEVRFNDLGLNIIPLETKLSIPGNKIQISENKFLFNDFVVIDSLGRPLTVNGSIDYKTTDDITVDLKVKADKIQLMNTKESNDAPLFGKIVVNSGLTIGGSIFSPTIKGDVELESGTNLTYQLIQDLSVRASQTDVVFATITDSLQVIYPQSETTSNSTKMPMIETTININPKSIFNVKIDDIYSFDITIQGSGLLNYNMLPNNTMSLNGDYEIKSGDCKLKITGWPLKAFEITPGSSLSWDGSIENPELNLEATTRVRGAYINPIDNKRRVVDFVVSMQIKNNLSDLGIFFDIRTADQYMSSVISSLSADEKMRQAVNLLLFETIDLPGIEKSSNYISSQITSFWESQLNSLSKTTLNKTQLSFGIDTYNEANPAGTQQEKTSFTYEMERKFLNDRATVKISGKLNDYNEGAYQTNSLFENFIFEYAFDAQNSKNLKLYQKRDYEDMLEGEVVKYGIGFLYRKNYRTLKDIWQRTKKPKQ
jgi:hypothetical protein